MVTSQPATPPNCSEDMPPSGNRPDQRVEANRVEKTSPFKSSPGSRPTAATGWIRRIAAPISLALLLGLWQLLALLKIYPEFILPSPATVAERFWEVLWTGALWKHTSTTLLEAGLGFVLAAGVVALLCYPIARSELVATLLSPVLAATQAVPLVALAPLLVIWFGFGLQPKVVTCALIVFFPLLLNAVSGLRGVAKELREAAEIFGATRWQAFKLVELPLALPTLLTGVKIGFTVSFTGAVVGEFIAADAGLGYLMNLGRGQFDTPLVFVGLLTLTAIATLAYGFVSWLEKKVQHRGFLKDK